MTTFSLPTTEQEDSASFLGDSPTVGKHPANGTADAGQFLQLPPLHHNAQLLASPTKQEREVSESGAATGQQQVAHNRN